LRIRIEKSKNLDSHPNGLVIGILTQDFLESQNPRDFLSRFSKSPKSKWHLKVRREKVNALWDKTFCYESIYFRMEKRNVTCFF
jgi:hypothetical protein